MSKHAVNRLIELIVLDSCCSICVFAERKGRSRESRVFVGTVRRVSQSAHAFALVPGVVRTRLAIGAGVGVSLNIAALPAATTLYLTSGLGDWVSEDPWTSYITHAR